MNKTILALLFFASASPAFALGANDSWDAIRASHEYIVEAPFHQFGPEGIFNACATPESLKSVTPVKVCADSRVTPGSSELPGQSYCAREELQNVSMPLKGTMSVCAEYAPANELSSGECIRFENRPYEISLVQNINVLYSGEAYPQVAFTKRYVIPACAH